MDFFYVLFLAEPPKLSIFSHNICFDFRLNHEQNKKNWFFFEKKRKNIDNSQSSEPTPSNVEVIVEQPQCASVYKEPALISEQPLTTIDIAHLIRDSSNRPQIWKYPVN
jgi:hypothetical protein